MDILKSLKRCGEDVRIAGTVVIKHPELVSIGNHVAIDDFCVVTTAMEIGDYVHVCPFVSIVGGQSALCILRDFTGLAAGCRLICGSDDYLGSGLTNPTIPRAYRARLQIAPVVLEKHALLGTNCVVHPGVTIGEGAAIGSCSLVTRSLEPWLIYRGIPAKSVRTRDKEKMLELEARLRKELSACPGGTYS
ncbi:MAG: acyltransferase [candidate division WOR-3 bacterium]|nr:acyltransferase [candidate division WOR-3 bacterium]